MEDFILKRKFINIMEIPKIENIILHSSSKRMISDKKYISTASLAAELISSQKSISVFSKKPIAAFNLRKNSNIGITITIRKRKILFNFLEKLIFVVYPNTLLFGGWKGIDCYGGWNNSFRDYSPFTETKPFFQFFDFLSGFDLAINIILYGSYLRSITQKKTLRRSKIFIIWESLFPLPLLKV